MKVTIGISPCPNDTYVYHALLNRCIQTPGIEFEFKLFDIQQLNQAVIAEELDVAKVSFAVANEVASSYQLLKVGAALGFGVGPIVVSKKDNLEPGENSSIVCPGRYTTAALLFKHFYPHCPKISHAIFSDIMNLVVSEQKDFGVLIHEGRFTYQAQGLRLVADLGALWEKQYQMPVPLGGLVAKRSLTDETIDIVTDAVQRSIRYSEQNPHEAIETMRSHAQEFDDTVLWKHVDLYVNNETYELSDIGRKAVSRLTNAKF